MKAKKLTANEKKRLEKRLEGRLEERLPNPVIAEWEEGWRKGEKFAINNATEPELQEILVWVDTPAYQRADNFCRAFARGVEAVCRQIRPGLLKRRTSKPGR